MLYRQGLILLLLGGCLPEPTNPVCNSDGDCLHFGGDWCNCRDGLCFKFDCPVAEPGPEPAACDGATLHVVADGCCPGGGDGAIDPDCTLDSGKLEFSFVDETRWVSDGAHAWITARVDGEVSAIRFDVGDALGGHRIPLGGARVLPPVLLSDGRVAVAGADGLLALSADGGSEVLAVIEPAGAPLELEDTTLVTVLPGGGLTNSGGAQPLAGEIPTGGRVFTLRTGDAMIAAVEGGDLFVIDLSSFDVRWRSENRAVAFAPAVAKDVVTASTGDALLAIRRGDEPDVWTPILDYALEDAGPPTADGDGFLVSSGGTSLARIVWSGQQATATWTAGDLGAAASAAPEALSDGTAVVGLQTGEVVAVTNGDTAWVHTLSGPAITPLPLADDTLLHLTRTGEYARIRSRR